MKKLLVLAAGVLQVPIIKKGKEMGCYVVAVDGDPNACGFKYADKAICTDILSEDELLRIAIDERIDGVIHPCSEVSMMVMGRINDELNLAGVTHEQAIKATNKHLMRIAFEKAGAPSPRSFITESCEDAWRMFCDEFDTDAILKPSRNSGSRGITKIERRITETDFHNYYAKALVESRDHSVLLEQYIDGPEFSVEIIVWDNIVNVLAVTDKKTTGAPHFVELGHSQPSCFPDDTIRVVKEAAILGVKALGVNACACHAEIKVQDGQAYLMEVGARLGGDFISTILTKESTGIDMVEAAINCSLGIRPDLTPRFATKGVCIRYFTPEQGVLRNIKNQNLLTDSDVISSEIYYQIGDSIPALMNSVNRAGHLIVTAKNVEFAISRAEDIISQIIFETR